MKNQLLLLFLFLLILTGCKKDEKLTGQDITGKWYLVESFDGYVNGGSFTWKDVSEPDSHQLLFSSDGKYLKQENDTHAFQKCAGTYNILPENKLELVSNCNTSELITVSELTPKMLILEVQVREGVIRYKYKAID